MKSPQNSDPRQMTPPQWCGKVLPSLGLAHGTAGPEPPARVLDTGEGAGSPFLTEETGSPLGSLCLPSGLQCFSL